MEKSKEENKYRYLIVIILIVCTVILIYTAYTFQRNLEVIKKDPLSYGLKLHNISYCTFTDANNYYIVNQSGVLKIPNK
jgi:hypothetical protein